MGVSVYKEWGGVKNVFIYKYSVSNAQSKILIKTLSEKFTKSANLSKKERKKGFFLCNQRL